MRTSIFSSLETRSNTISLGSLNSGIPYIVTPPGRSRPSKTSTACPICANFSAAVMPAGPSPIIATCLPVGGLRFGTSEYPFIRTKSAAKRSSAPIATGSPRIPSTHAPSHCLFWLHRRPQIADIVDWSASFFAASLTLPFAMSDMNSGIFMWLGQPIWHLGLGQ